MNNAIAPNASLLGGFVLALALGACSGASDLIEIASDARGVLISSEAIEGTNEFNCRYRREDGQEWVRRQTDECDSSDSNFKINP